MEKSSWNLTLLRRSLLLECLYKIQALHFERKMPDLHQFYSSQVKYIQL